jgi:hypothetical protein
MTRDFLTLTLLWARPLGTTSLRSCRHFTAYSFQLSDLVILATYEYKKQLHDDNGVDGGGVDDYNDDNEGDDDDYDDDDGKSLRKNERFALSA